METEPPCHGAMATPAMDGSAAGPVRRPARRRRHLLAALVLAGLPALVVTLDWVASWPPDGVDTRLLVLMGVVLAVAATVADGFDHRYPEAGPGTVALRLAGLTAVIVLALVVAADAWVYSGTDGDQRFWPFAIGAAGLASAVAGRHLAKARGPAPVVEQRPTNGILAVIVVSLPFGLGYSLLSFFAALCGYGAVALVLFTVGIGSPGWLGLVERGLNRRWPRSGLAFSVGRLSLVAVLVSAAFLVLLTAVDSDDGGCESTLRTPAAVAT